MGISISLGISPRESISDWISFAQALDQRDVDRLWLIDSQLAMKDVYAGLLTAALHTHHVELGTGVTNIVTRHPTITMNSIAAVSELSEGRAVLGLGAGDSAVFGLGKRPSRVAEVEAAIRFFRAVLNGKAGQWEGRSYRLLMAVPPVKVYLAVSQPRMCALAGRLADGAIIMGPAQPDLVARQLSWIEDGLEQSGRDRSELEVCFVATISTAEDPEIALRDVRAWATGQARLLADFKELPDSLRPFQVEIARAKETYDYSEHLSTRAGHASAISDEFVRALAIIGSAEESRERLRVLLNTGINDLIFPLMGSGRLERLVRLTTEIRPALRA
ncbi:MAG TPA: LLM class flavin-dependent oxidoreductase [Solirubrobacteraceae bacterium]|jgi:5,10-methylenetetrahydromethanopterin reductase|nr:LLM class flavin-dependent oxidoreductase [Solirubrobacteraceae bacterium]